MSQSDSRLVTAALAGDEQSVEALVHRYQRRAHAVALAVGLSTVESDDVVQESFLQAINKLSSLRVPACFGSWFLQIVRNTARRYAGPELFKLSPNLDERAGRETKDFESRELREMVRRELSGLPERVREAIFLYYYEGESVRAVAEATGSSVSAVKKRLQRGREQLRHALWREFEDSVRRDRPSAHEWNQRGRQLALVLLASPTAASSLFGAAHATEVSASAQSPATSAGGGAAASTAIGGTIMAKKLLIGAAAAAVLFIVGLLLIDGMLVPADPPTVETAMSRAPTEERTAARRSAVDVTAPAPIETDGPVEVADVDDAAPVEAYGGTVVDPAGAHVAGAYVVAAAGTYPEARKLATTLTDDEGRFQLAVPEGRPVRLFAFKPGVGLGFTEEVPPGPAAAEVTLDRLSEVSGRLYDRDTGEGVAGQVLSLARFDTAGVGPDVAEAHYTASTLFGAVLARSGSVTTDARGLYRFIHVSPLRFEFRFRSEGTDHVLPGFRRGETPPEVLLEPGERRTVDFALERGGSIAGTVFGPDDEPLPGATVELLLSYPTRHGRSMKTGARGAYRFGGLVSEATYLVGARFEGLATTLGRKVEMATPERFEDEDIQLFTGRSVTGRFIDDDGVPLAEMGVDLWRDTPFRTPREADGRAVTGEDGTFLFENVGPGEYVLSPHTEEFEHEQPLSFTMPRDEDLHGLEFVLRRAEVGGFIAGRVVDPEGEPVSGVVVWVWKSKPFKNARSGEDGSFRVSGLPEKEAFKVTVYSRDHFGRGVGSVPINTSDLLLVVARRGLISGRVFDVETGEPIERFRLRAFFYRTRSVQFHFRWRTFDSPKGEFLVALADPLEGQVEVQAPGYVTATSARFVVPPGGAAEGVQVGLRRGAALRGNVVDAATGEPIEGAHIRGHQRPLFQPWLTDENRASYRRREYWQLTMSTIDGSFELGGVEPGDMLHLVVWKEGYGTVARRGVKVAEGRGPVRIRLAREAALLIDVRFRPRETESFTVAAHHRVEKPWRSAFYRSVTLGRPGVAELDGLPPGPYRVVVYRSAARGGRKAPELVGEMRVAVEAGERRELRLDVEELARRFRTIEGVVRGVAERERVVLEIASKKDPGEHYSVGSNTCDAAGRFRFTGLAPGHYVITARNNAVDPPSEVSRTVRVDDGKGEVTSDVELVFE